jgi:hypothetical protein
VQVLNSSGDIYTCDNGTWTDKTNGGGGSGTVSGQANGVIPLATASTIIGAQSALSDNGTTITSTEPVHAPSLAATGSDPFVNLPTNPTHPCTAGDLFNNAGTLTFCPSSTPVPLPVSAMVNITGTVTITGCTVSAGSCTVGTPGTTFAISSIPSGYNSLKIIILGNTSSTISSALITFNGDTGSHYVNQETYSSGSSAAGFANGGGLTTYMTPCSFQGSSVATGANSCEITIPFFANTTFNKSVIASGGYTATSTGLTATNTYCAWLPSVPAAITSISIKSATANFVAGTQISIYGIN